VDWQTRVRALLVRASAVLARVARVSDGAEALARGMCSGWLLDRGGGRVIC
jgi:hypothetical protein